VSGSRALHSRQLVKLSSRPLILRGSLLQPAVKRSVTDRLSIVVVVLALGFGVGVRTFRLDGVPPGFHWDEACVGYDAYSILKTGRDHHGHFLPLNEEGFNDYRRPLLTYSLIPLIEVLGLNVTTVRLGAALWGISDLVAITTLAGLMLGWPGAAAAAVFAAVSPWHLSFSRVALQGGSGAAIISIATLFFWLWLKSRRSIWLYLSAFVFGLSLYSFTIADAFTPLFLAFLALLYWREFRDAGGQSLRAAALFVLLAIPLAASFVMYPAQMNARFDWLSILTPGGCFGCTTTPLSVRLATSAAGFVGYFTPSFLFVHGDLGDHWTLIHVPGFGQLLPEQAPLIALALFALVAGRRRKTALFLLGWTVLATLPAAVIRPLGANSAEPGKLLPTAWMVFDPSTATLPVTPWLIFSHPDSRHAVLAMVPWILLSALGFVTLLELTSSRRALRIALCAALAAGTLFHAARFIRSYFIDYPVLAAPYFQYGWKQVMEHLGPRGDPAQRVVITKRGPEPYIYVLFFGHYPPERFQTEPVVSIGRSSSGGVAAFNVYAFDRYVFVMPDSAYRGMEHGTFVFAGADPIPVPPTISIKYPDGTVAYNIVSK
jgi:4-amino-4-deoxy-L-arabinose transferase-like glycosyltransferase